MWRDRDMQYVCACLCVITETQSQSSLRQTRHVSVRISSYPKNHTHISTHWACDTPSFWVLNLDRQNHFSLLSQVNFINQQSDRGGCSARVWAYLWFPDFDDPGRWYYDTGVGPQWTRLLYLVQHETCYLVVELQGKKAQKNTPQGRVMR